MKKNGQLVRDSKAEIVRCNLSYFIFPHGGAVSLDGFQKGDKRKTEERTGTWKLRFYKDTKFRFSQKANNLMSKYKITGII